jgi:hypothetical protein
MIEMVQARAERVLDVVARLLDQSEVETQPSGSVIIGTPPRRWNSLDDDGRRLQSRRRKCRPTARA